MEGQSGRTAQRYHRAQNSRRVGLLAADSKLIPSAGAPICLAKQLFAADATAACPPPDCPICCQPMLFVSIGRCRDLVCWVCAAKLRLLQKTKGCPFCKVELPYVVVARTPPFRDYLPSQLQKKLQTSPELASQDSTLNEQVFTYLENWLASKYTFDPDRYPAEVVDESVGVIFANVQSKRAFEALSQYICWHPKCTTGAFLLNSTARVLRFPTQEAWRAHCASAHGAEACSICLEALNVFPFELLLYASTDLARHAREGDNLINGAIEPHRLCSVCQTLFFNLEAYKQHVKKDHLTCYMCDEAAAAQNPPTAPPAFRRFDDLGRHYAEKHVVCPLCEFVGLRDEGDLALHNAQIHASGTGMRLTVPRREHQHVEARHRPVPERRNNRESESRFTLQEEDSRQYEKRRNRHNEEIRHREVTRHREENSQRENRHHRRGDIEDKAHNTERFENPESGSAGITYRPVGKGTIPKKSKKQQHLRDYTEEQEPSSNRKPLQKSPDRRTSRPQNFWQYEDPIAENWRLVAHLAVRQARTSTVATRERANSKLLEALHAFFGDDERGKRELDRCFALSQRWIDKEMESIEFLREMLKIFWNYYPENAFSRPRSEPQRWSSWREHRSRLHPSFELINLLVAAREPTQLLDAVEAAAIDPLHPRCQSCRSQTYPSHHKEEYDPTSDGEERTVLDEYGTLKDPKRVEERVSPSSEGAPAQLADGEGHMMATSSQEALHNSKKTSAPRQHRRTAFDAPVMSFDDSSKPQLSNDRQMGANSGSNDPSIVTLSQALLRGPKKPVGPAVAVDFSGTKNSGQPEQHIPTSPSKFSDDENEEEEFPLEFVSGATFIDALIAGVYLFRVIRGHPTDQPLFELPNSIKDQLAETSRASLAVLGNFKALSAGFLSSRAVEKIQALRPYYFLVAKQVETETEIEKTPKKNEWARRVRAALTTLDEKELDFLTAYLHCGRALLPEAARLEDFPALDGNSGGVDFSTFTGPGAMRTKNRVKSLGKPDKSINVLGDPYHGKVRQKLSGAVLRSATHFPDFGASTTDADETLTQGHSSWGHPAKKVDAMKQTEQGQQAQQTKPIKSFVNIISNSISSSSPTVRPSPVPWNPSRVPNLPAKATETKNAISKPHAGIIRPSSMDFPSLGGASSSSSGTGLVAAWGMPVVRPQMPTGLKINSRMQKTRRKKGTNLKDMAFDTNVKSAGSTNVKSAESANGKSAESAKTLQNDEATPAKIVDVGPTEICNICLFRNSVHAELCGLCRVKLKDSPPTVPTNDAVIATEDFPAL